MAFLSRLRPGEMIIDDTNYQKLVEDADSSTECGRGYEARDWGVEGVAAPFSMPTIPRDRWPEMIKEREQRGQLLSKICDEQGIESLYQEMTYYCWVNAVITAMETIRAANGLPYVKLSPASAGAPVKGFRNVGGWGSEALAYIVANGVCPVSVWPANAIDKRYYTAANRELAKNYRVPEWYDLRDRSFDQLMTCLLLGWPVPIGLLWWGHEVCAMDPVMIGANRFGARIRNSWGGSWGDNGFAILEESKATPDDAVAPRMVTVI